MMSSTHWEVQVVVELMISTCPDSSDGRALDMQSEGRGFKFGSELKILKALVWRLHVRFRVVMCKMGYTELRFNIYI